MKDIEAARKEMREKLVADLKKAIDKVLDEMNEALNFMHCQKELHADEIIRREAKIEAIQQDEMALRRRICEVRNDVKDGKYF